MEKALRKGGDLVTRRRHSKENIIVTLQNLAHRLGKKTLSKSEMNSVISASSINYHFGTLGRALEAAGLSKYDPSAQLEQLHRRHSLSDEELFQSLQRLERQIGKEPTLSEYNANGDYSNKPFKRFGKWCDVLAYYRKWRVEASQSDGSTAGQLLKQVVPSARPEPQAAAWSEEDRPQLFGEAVDFRGLRNAPINEQGVVFLFGMVSAELGFSIEALQEGFPDCEGKYLYDRKKKLWAKARIEFEFRASSFRQHGHDSGHCDFIVCWENDWPDCPIRVLELSKEILKLPSRLGR